MVPTLVGIYRLVDIRLPASVVLRGSFEVEECRRAELHVGPMSDRDRVPGCSHQCPVLQLCGTQRTLIERSQWHDTISAAVAAEGSTLMSSS
jgi:hypothetical protein